MKAWQLLKSKKQWSQGGYAVDLMGIVCNPEENHAVKWCALGAIIKVYGGHTQKMNDKRITLSHYVHSQTRFLGTAAWNDDKNQRFKQVKAVLRRLGI